jgi:hypothetical protein
MAKFPVTLLVCTHSTPFSIRCKTICLQARYVTLKFVRCLPQWKLKFTVGITLTAAHKSSANHLLRVLQRRPYSDMFSVEGLLPINTIYVCSLLIFRRELKGQQRRFKISLL